MKSQTNRRSRQKAAALSSKETPTLDPAGVSVGAKQLHHLTGGGSEFKPWLVALTWSCRTLKDYPIFQIKPRDDGDHGIPLALASFLTSQAAHLHAALANLAIQEALAGEHSQDSLDSALDICIRLIPDSQQRVDARLLHRFLEEKQPFSLWMSRPIKKFGMTLDRDYFRTSPHVPVNLVQSGNVPAADGEFSVTARMATTIVMESGGRRSARFKVRVYRCMGMMEPDLVKRMTSMFAPFNSENSTRHQA